MSETITIARRYNGPPDSGQGGYTAGLIAGLLGGSDVQVTLRRPPPLDTPLNVQREEGAVRISAGEEVVAEAEPATLSVELPEPVARADAEIASQGYPGFKHHPFPTCFVCGPDRGDGMRIYAGPVAGRDIAAATWTPDASLAGPDGAVQPEFVWAALDCPGGWGANDFSLSGRDAVLGRITAHIESPLRAGETYVVVGWAISIDGRKMQAGSAIFSENGAALAYAVATWILRQ